ncbi:unnamed protein product [Symbiodinium sp. CCMP2456]|nr:unnamed protein product [Symbiodinium sp. CCMP2456]
MWPIPDTQRLQGYPDAEAEDFDDLADGSILADVLQLYAPAVDPSNSAAGSAKLLHGCLTAYFGSRVALPRLAGNMHNGTFCKPGLLRALSEAVMLAAVEGPRKEEAIQAIMNLEEPQQLALGAALQRLVADAPEQADQKGSLSRQGTDASLTDSGPPTPRDQSVYKSEADILQDQLQEMRDRLNSEEMALSGMESSQKSLEAQLRTVIVDHTAEEEQAAEADALLQKWQRSHGEDLRQFKAECDSLRSDLDRETENWQDLPQRESRLQKQLKTEVDAVRDLQDKNGNLEVEIQQAAQSSANDDVSTVKAEMMTSQMQQNVVDRLLRKAENEDSLVTVAVTGPSALGLCSVSSSREEKEESRLAGAFSPLFVVYSLPFDAAFHIARPNRSGKPSTLQRYLLEIILGMPSIDVS